MSSIMSQRDIRMVSCSALDDAPYNLNLYLSEGYKITHVIPFEYFTVDSQWMHPTDGSGSYEIQIKNNQSPYIKYILERDGISRLLHG